MVINFAWDASTSVSNLTDVQQSQLLSLCSRIGNNTHVDVAEMVASTVTSVAFAPGAERTPSVIVWTVGLFFVSLINMCAIVGIGVMRYLSKDIYNQVITLFVGLGVGSLSGSSFYHLLPSAHPRLVDEMDEFGHKTHSYLHMAHFSLLGVYLFFMCDKVIKIVLETRKRTRNESAAAVSASEKGLLTQRSDLALLNGHGDGFKTMEDASVPEMELMKILESNAGKSMGDQAHGICVHDHSLDFQVGDSAIAAVAWMIIFGDGFHNFIDGISIGAAFGESVHSGLSVSLAVLCEEFPHELGDVAILVAAGMTLRQALLYNLLSAITCYIGFFIGVGIGELSPEVSKYAFALAGGMFLYIALGCMMPEMKKAMEEALNVSLRRGLYVLFLQTVGLILGLNLMFVMAKYGEEFELPTFGGQ